jgi:hypothetical protein
MAATHAFDRDNKGYIIHPRKTSAVVGMQNRSFRHDFALFLPKFTLYLLNSEEKV